MLDIPNTLSERGKSHGPYSEDAGTAVRLWDTLHASANWCDLTAPQQHAATMIAVKLARIVSGDPSFPDHWRDIAGYATLVLDLLAPPDKE